MEFGERESPRGVATVPETLELDAASTWPSRLGDIEPRGKLSSPGRRAREWARDERSRSARQRDPMPLIMSAPGRASV